ncbi:MAG: T9SS type A sorting domain-containing protein [candidate division Zixibacteria bacterium]
MCDRSSDTIIENNTMVKNTARAYGGAICLWYSDLIIINNIIAYNSAGAGGGYSSEFSYPLIVNSIFWGDSSNIGNEIHVENDPEPVVEFCDIDGSWEGQGNINNYPLFRDPENGDYHLMAIECGDSFDSPCIDAGDPSIFDYLLDCDWGLGYERSDMGAYGGMAIPTDIKEHERDLELPRGICLSQNYPNPFNSSTVINYSLSKTSFVIVSIYNVLGQLETTVFEGIQQAGRQSITWDADDYPSGVYFARVETDKRSANIRMVLLK